MTQAEGIIIILLIVITYLLYQIARQLSFLTGRRLNFRLPHIDNFFSHKHKSDPPTKLSN